MNLHSHLLRQLLAASLLASSAIAQSPPLLTTGVEITPTNAQTTLNRTTGKLSSRVDVKIKNTSDRLLQPPLHAVATFTPAAGSTLTGLTATGLTGALAQPPYQTFYKDLSAAIGSGLAVNAETTFSFTFDRPSSATITYAIAIRGIRNTDPVASIGGPYSAGQNTPVSFDAAASSDPDGETLTYAWDFGDGTTGTGATPQHSYAIPGLYTVRVTVTDPRLGSAFRETEVPIVPAGVFALARTRTLDGNGHPLGGVSITQTGPGGTAQGESDAVSGFTSLGGEPGDHAWVFSKPGHLTSHRKATLSQGSVKVVAFPWLALLSTQRTPLSALNPTAVKSPSEKITLTVPPGAFEQIETLAITDLHGQNLPLPLPHGWSPLAAFHLDMPGEAAETIAASVKLLQSIAAAKTLVLARCDTTTVSWTAQSVFNGNDTDLASTTLRKPGSYAIVIADELPAGNPVAAVSGETLPAGTSPVVAADVSAVGNVNPTSSLASTDPAKVTATATVDFTNGTQPLPSGAWFLAEVEETYDLRDGRALKTPDYDATFYAYQTPGDALAPTATATFPMRPRVLFSPAELSEANIHVQVHALNPFSGGIITAEGGFLTLPGIKVSAPAGAVSGPAAAESRLLSITSLNRFLGSFVALSAFELNLPRLTDGTVLSLTLTNKFTPDTNFVLARCVGTGSESGLQPVLRMASDATGTVTSIEPTTGARLPGLTGSGQYVLVQLTEAQALITGLVRRIGGALLSGGIVRVTDEPWLSLTSSTGTFFTLAEPGSRTVTGSDPADGNSGQATATLADATSHAQVEIQTAPTGPKVLATTPVAGEPRASLVAPITIEFSEPIQPATFAADGLRLRGIAANLDVPGSVTLELSNRRASFFPTNPLAFATDYQIIVSSAIRDLQNLPIEGTLTFAFKTQPSDARPAGAQLVIYEPDAENIPPAILNQLVGYDPDAKLSMVVASGSPGTADPEVPVILVNETTGETATVLSKPDGSFTNFVRADEADFISAVFVNLNGTRITVPATRQLFDDGRVGLYRPGGILEAENEDRRVQVLVEPGAVPNRTKFTVDVLAAQQLHDLLEGTQPETGGKVLSGVRYVEEGEPVTSAVDVAIDLKPGDLPEGVDPTQATFALTVPVEIEGKKGFQIIDSMSFEPGGAAGQGKLVTHSPPFMGVLLRQLNYMRAKAPFRDTLVKAHTAGFGEASSHSQVSAFLVGVLVAPIVPQVIGGLVVAAPHGSNDPATFSTVSGALVRFEVGLGAIDSSDPGLFRAGECFTMTAEDGSFAITRPNAFNRQVIATHPRFPFQRAASSGIPAGETVARMKLIFREKDMSGSAPDGSSPVIEIVQTPLSPRVGQAADLGAILEVTSKDDVSITAVNATRQAFMGFVGGELDFQNLLPPTTIGTPVLVGTEDRRRFLVQALEPGWATIRVSAVDGVGNVTSKDVTLSFGAGGGAVTTKHRLAFTWPSDKTEGVAVGAPIILRVVPAFTQEMVDDFSTWLSTSTENAIITSVDFSSDRREATVHYRITGDPVDLTLGFNGQYFDDRGGHDCDPRLGGAAGEAEEEAEGPTESSVPPTYKIVFAPERALNVTGTQVVSGAGAVTLGRYTYALDRNNGAGRLMVYELQDDGEVTFENEESLDRRLGRPNDVVLIPSYALRGLSEAAADFVRNPQISAADNNAAGVAAASQAGPVIDAASYIAIVGGDPQSGSWLQVFKINASDGTLSGMLSGGAVPLTTGNSLVVGIKWDAPFLGVNEIAAGTTSVRLINFNRLVNGFDLLDKNPDLLEKLPNDGIAGIDIDNDGAFVSEGERAPLPGRHDGLIFGTEFTWAPLSGDQRITDFAFHGGSGLLAVTFRQVGASPGSGLAMILGGTAGLLDPNSAQVSWAVPGGGQEAKRLLLLTGQRYFKADGTPAEGDLALISTMAGSAPQGKIMVVDVSDPAHPNRLGEAIMPTGSGTLNTLVKRADGLVAASLTTGGVILVDPALLLMPPPVGSTETPAIVRALPALVGGGQRTFSTEPAGVHFTANGGPMQAALTAPLFRIVNFDHAPFKMDDLRSGSVGTGPDKVTKIISVLRDSSSIRTASLFDPANAAHHTDPARHHYVLIDAPGVAGNTLPMALAALRANGAPYLPERDYLVPGVLGYDQLTAKYAVVTALNLLKYLDIEEIGTSILSVSISELLDKVKQKFTIPDYPEDLIATRLSEEPANPLYNMYLAGPFVLPTRDLKNDEITNLNTDALPRRFLAAASALWAGLGPDLADDSLLKPFAARQDESISADLNIGLDLNTLFALADIVEGIGAAVASGGTAAVPAAALIAKGLFQLVDFSLERILQPAVTVYAHVGRSRRAPLIFVPGIMGSEMVDAADTDSLFWVELSNALTSKVRQLELNDRGEPAGEGKPAVPKDVVRKVATADLGEGLLNHIQSELGYRPQDLSSVKSFKEAMCITEEMQKAPPDFFVFAYDWRRDNAVSAAELAKYIDMILSLHPDAESVDIIAHSMGGLVTRRLMLEHPNVVGKAILIASPLLGATKSVYTKREGDLDEWKMNLLVPRDANLRISRHMAGLDQLMPTQAAFRLGFRPIWEDGVDLNGDGHAFGSLKYEEYKSFLDTSLFPAEPSPAPTPIATNNHPFHSDDDDRDSQDDWRDDGSGTELYHLVGVQTIPKTITRLLVHPKLEQVPEEEAKDIILHMPPTDETDTNEIIGGMIRVPVDGDAAFPLSDDAYRLVHSLELVYGGGDGTVPLLSAARGFGADRNFDLNPARMRVIPVVSETQASGDNKRVSHVDVLVNNITKRWVSRILTGQFRNQEVPKFTINAGHPSGSLAEGAMTALTVLPPATPPPGVSGSPVYTWDLGDGRMIYNQSSVSVGYPEDGDYVVTCVGRYPGGDKDDAVAQMTSTAGVAGLVSYHVHVNNALPAPVITFEPPSPVAGESVKFRVNANDPSPLDTFEYEWTTGEGGGASTKTDVSFLTHTYSSSGNYAVTVKVRDDDGGEGTVIKLINVGTVPPAPPAGPHPPPSAATDPNPFDNNPSAGQEFAKIRCSGVQINEDLVTLTHGEGPSIINQVINGFQIQDDGGSVDSVGASSIQVEVHRNLSSGGRANTSTLKVQASAPSVTFQLEYINGAGATRVFTHACTTTVGSSVEFQLKWDDLLSLPEADVARMTTPIATHTTSTPFIARPELATETEYREGTGAFFMGLANLGILNDPAPAQNRVFLGGAISPAESQLPVQPPNKDDLLREVVIRVPYEAATVPSRYGTVVVETPDGKVTTAAHAQPATKKSGLTDAEAAEVRNAITGIITSVRNQARGPDSPSNAGPALIGRFLLSLNDLLIFEQGTGAALWKGAEAIRNCAYVKGSSDNDYELFFPARKSKNLALDPTNPVHIQTFPEIAHSQEIMEGDWYFRPPNGYAETEPLVFNPVTGTLDFSFKDLGPPPAFDDPAYEAFVAQVTHWGYTVPTETTNGLRHIHQPYRIGDSGVVAWRGSGAFADLFHVGSDDSANRLYLVKKGAAFFGENTSPNPFERSRSPFESPLTPGQIIAYALTQTVINTPAARSILKDISFFPFRREHFLFAVMSLEKPPPFGDDPVGDAGMGRGLLLLKWILEGVFIDPIDEINNLSAIPELHLADGTHAEEDIQLRNMIHARLLARSHTLKPEAYEWALFQEFALLSENGLLRVRPQDPAVEAARKRKPLFGDFITKRDNKVMKKAGKATIRAALGPVMLDEVAAESILSVTPSVYASNGYRTFEHLVAEVAGANAERLFAGFDHDGSEISSKEINQMLGAKSSEDSAFDSIRKGNGGVDEFLLRCFTFLERLQQNTSGGYFDFLSSLRDLERFDELAARTHNIAAVNFGYTPPGGVSRAGREAMLGLDSRPAEQAYLTSVPFALNIANHTKEDISEVKVSVSDDPPELGQDIAPVITIPVLAAGQKLVIPNEDYQYLVTEDFFNPENPKARITRTTNGIELLTRHHSVKDRIARPFLINLTNSSGFVDDSNDMIKLQTEILDFNGSLGPTPRDLRLRFKLVQEAGTGPPHDCRLIPSVHEIGSDGFLGPALTGATFHYRDSTDRTFSIPAEGLLLNQGHNAEFFAWPIDIEGSLGGARSPPVAVTADVRNVFLTGSTPTPSQRNFLDAVAVMQRSPETAASALAPSVRDVHNSLHFGNYPNLLTGNNRVFVGTNADTVNGVIVRDAVSYEANPVGLSLGGLDPLDVQISPFLISEANTRSHNFNPVRSGILTPGSNQANGDIYILQDFMDRVDALEDFDFRHEDGSTMTIVGHELLVVELFHEFNHRILSIAGCTENGLRLDQIFRQAYFPISQQHEFLFQFEE